VSWLTKTTTCQHQCQSLREWCLGLTSMDQSLQASVVQHQLFSSLPIPTTKRLHISIHVQGYKLHVFPVNLLLNFATWIKKLKHTYTQEHNKQILVLQLQLLKHSIKNDWGLQNYALNITIWLYYQIICRASYQEVCNQRKIILVQVYRSIHSN